MRTHESREVFRRLLLSYRTQLDNESQAQQEKQRLEAQLEAERTKLKDASALAVHRQELVDSQKQTALAAQDGQSRAESAALEAERRRTEAEKLTVQLQEELRQERTKTLQITEGRNAEISAERARWEAARSIVEKNHQEALDRLAATEREKARLAEEANTARAEREQL